MKKYLIAATLFLLPFGVFCATEASAEFNLNIGINLPTSGVMVSSSPDVVAISGTYVYFIPNTKEDVFFYHGYWYRTHKSRWYRSADHNRGWVFVSTGKIPSSVRGIRPGFRKVPPGQVMIPYGQLKKNWKSWEKERRKERVREAKEHHKGHGRHDGHGGRRNKKHKK